MEIFFEKIIYMNLRICTFANYGKSVHRTCSFVSFKIWETSCLSILEKTGTEKCGRSVKSNLENHGYWINIYQKHGIKFGIFLKTQNHKTSKP